MGIQELHGDICSQYELAKQLSNSHFVGWSNLHEETVHDSESSAHHFHHVQADACSSSSSSDESSKSSLSPTSCSSGKSSPSSVFSCSSGGAASNLDCNYDSVLPGKCHNRGGGKLNLLRKTAFSKNAKCLHKVLVPGRALESKIEDNGNIFILVNIHLYGLSLPKAQGIADCLRSHALQASLEPTKYFVSVLGDFNFRYDDKPILQIPDFKAFSRNLNCPKFLK